MELHAIFTKTPRGITEVKTRAARLPRNLLSILALVDGKSTLDRLLRESKLAETKFRQAIARLEEEGFIKVFAADRGGDEGAGQIRRPRRLQAVSAEGLDELDFCAIARSALEEKTDEGSHHAPGFRASPPSAPADPHNLAAEARASAEAEARRIAEEALKAQAAAEAKARADEEARVRAEAQARAEIEARARMAADAEARSKADSRARLEAHMKAEAERKARAEAERRAAEERHAREVLEARLEAEKAARAEAEQRAREEAERKAKEEAEARLAEELKNREEAELRAREEVERRAKEELQTRLAEERLAREEAARHAREEAEQKAREEMEAKLSEERKAREELAAQLAAEHKAKEQAELQVREAVERKAQEESERRAREEAERLAHEESERLARDAFESRLATERRAREEAERRAEEEHALRQREEAERRAQDEADRKAREEAEHRAAEEAGQRARDEAEHKAREAAERKMREELEANLAVERKARENAERRAEEEAEARVRNERHDAERRMREEVEREAREQAEREAREEAARRELEALEQRAREAAEQAAAAEDIARRQNEEAERQAREEGEAKALAAAALRELEETECRATCETADQASRDFESDTALESVDAPIAESPEAIEATATTDPGASTEAPEMPHVDVASFFEIDLDALDARERQLRAEEEEKLKLEAERHAHELAAKDQAERDASAEVARLEQAAEEATRMATEEADRAAQEEERRRADAAERQRREEEERRLQEEVARKARLEKEQRIREEAERRDREETAVRVQAEAQRKAEEKQQKKRAKEEEKARRRAEAEEKARVREAAKATAIRARGAQQAAKWHKPVVVSALLIIVAAVALLHLVPLSSFAPGMERLAASTLGEPVKIGSVRAGLFPSPHVKLAGVVVGKQQDVKIAFVRAVPELSSLFSDQKVLSSLELQSVVADENVLHRLPVWVAPERGKSLRVAAVVLRDVKLDSGTIAVPPFSGHVRLDAAGTFSTALLRSEDGKLTVELRNKPDRIEADFVARGWKSPIGPGIEFDEIAGKAVAQGTDVTVSDVTARLYGGTATGHAKLTWNGPWALAGDFSVNQLDLATTLRAFTNQFRATGRLAASGRYSAQSSSFDHLFAEPVVDAEFKAERGELDNLDLTRALQQAASATPVRGGKTQFAEISGTVKVSGKIYQYRQLALSSGILRASGNTEMGPSGDLAGRLNIELAAKPNPIRALAALSGKLSDPQLKASR